MKSKAPKANAAPFPLFQAHPWHGVPPSAGDGAYNAFIEIVPTDVVKYEIDKPSGQLRLDRPQRFSSLCPTLYGFIPQTYCGDQVAARCVARVGGASIEGDGDPLDVCVLTEKTIVHGGFLARMRPIGGLRMIDGNQADDKIVAVLDSDLSYGHWEDIAACPPGLLDRLKHYFLSYKRKPEVSDHPVRIAEVYDQAEALKVLELSLADYRAKFGNPEDHFERFRKGLGWN